MTQHTATQLLAVRDAIANSNYRAASLAAYIVNWTEVEAAAKGERMYTQKEAKELYRRGAIDCFGFSGMPSEFKSFVNDMATDYMKQHFNVTLKP